MYANILDNLNEMGKFLKRYNTQTDSKLNNQSE